MTTPDKEIEKILFEKNFDKSKLIKHLSSFHCCQSYINIGEFKEINWLNTPGPIYTTYTDNCGTGQVEAMSNVGGDEDYHEIIFKQPFTQQELIETLNAAGCDPFNAYYFDGNLNWNKDNILEWWSKSESRINYVIDRYENELDLPDKPHNSRWEIGNEIKTLHLFGPIKPIPENYKNWLDFYQFGMKEYLEWYINKIENHRIILPPLQFDWKKRLDLDEKLIAKTK